MNGKYLMSNLLELTDSHSHVDAFELLTLGAGGRLFELPMLATSLKHELSLQKSGILLKRQCIGLGISAIQTCVPPVII